MLVVLAACLVAYTLRPPARPHAYAARPSTRIRCAASPFDDIVPVTPDYMTDPVPAALARLGYGRVRRVTDVSPGPELSMAHLRYDTDEGPVYCKRSRRKVDQLADEATSLRVLRSAALAASVLRVPRPLETGELPLGGSFLLLEWVEADAPFGASLPSVLERLGVSRPLGCAQSRPSRALASAEPTGPPIPLRLTAPTRASIPLRPTACPRPTIPPWPSNPLRPRARSRAPPPPPLPSQHGLAALHTTPQPPPARGFGFVCDGHLGLDRLSNAWDPSHASFFVKRRLAPQLGAASAPMAAAASAAAWGEEGARRLASRADDLLCAAELLLRPCDTSDPALLHGNLWLGNVGATPDLEPVVFDPACFYGLPE